ncbi:MAG: YaiI/YqxD family protein [Gammaproteobacteria bacterium]
MRIWVDADACPRVIRDIVIRAAEKRAIETIFVANQSLGLPPSPWVRAVRVPGGFDAADHHIAAAVQPGDLVITADIPLASAVIAQGGLALNPRGTLYDESNIGERLAVRDMLEELRDQRRVRGGPPPLDQKDRAAFANQFDRLLARSARG